MIEDYEQYTQCIRRLADALLEVMQSEADKTNEKLVVIQGHINKLEPGLKAAKEYRKDVLSLLDQTAKEIKSVKANVENKEYAMIIIKSVGMVEINEAVPEMDQDVSKIKQILEELEYDT